MEPEQLKRLTAPFPKEALRKREIGKKGSGKWVDYIPGHTVIHRLNDCTGNDWNLEILDLTSDKAGSGEVLRAHVRLTIPGLGSREHIGIQSLYAGGGEDLIKGVITDALKKAATLFGVGLELYGEDFEDENYQPPQPSRPVARAAPPQPKPAPTPIRPAAAPAPSQASQAAFFAWVNKSNLGQNDVLTALGTESTADWLKANPGKDWADLQAHVERAIFGAIPEAIS